MTKTKQSIFLTGASGFLGRHLLRQLQDDGYMVYATSQSENKQFNVHGVDLRNIDAVQEALQTVRPNIILHVGAVVNLTRDYEVAKKCVETNIIGTMNLLESIRSYPISHFILSSTEEVYGKVALPYREDDLVVPPSPYAMTKLASEHMCRLYAEERNFPLTIFRIGTMYGPDQPKERFIPQAILHALRNENIPLNSGVKMRDYIHVRDVVSAFRLALSKNSDTIETINLGGGSLLSLKGLVEKIIKICQSTSRLDFGRIPDRPSEAEKWEMDISKAFRLLGWEPKIDIDEGLSKEVEFLKKEQIVNHENG